MIAVGGGAQYFSQGGNEKRCRCVQVDDEKMFDNFRRYPGRQCGARGFIRLSNE